MVAVGPTQAAPGVGIASAIAVDVDVVVLAVVCVLLVDGPIAVVIDGVATQLLMPGADQLLSRRAVELVEVAISVHVRVAGVALEVTVQVGLVRVPLGRAVVRGVHEPVAVLIDLVERGIRVVASAGAIVLAAIGSVLSTRLGATRVTRVWRPVVDGSVTGHRVGDGVVAARRLAGRNQALEVLAGVALHTRSAGAPAAVVATLLERARRRAAGGASATSKEAAVTGGAGCRRLRGVRLTPGGRDRDEREQRKDQTDSASHSLLLLGRLELHTTGICITHVTVPSVGGEPDRLGALDGVHAGLNRLPRDGVVSTWNG